LQQGIEDECRRVISLALYLEVGILIRQVAG